jgi:hypothetical protein
VNFVDDVDLVARSRRKEGHFLPELPDLVNPAVGGTVDFHDVQGFPLEDPEAIGAAIAGLAVLGSKAIGGPGEDPGKGSFSHAALPSKKVGVMELSQGNCPLKRGHNEILAHYFGKAFGSPPPIKGKLLHRGKG